MLRKEEVLFWKMFDGDIKGFFLLKRFDDSGRKFAYLYT